jgi:hypothetical protein
LDNILEDWLHVCGKRIQYANIKLSNNLIQRDD